MPEKNHDRLPIDATANSPPKSSSRPFRRVFLLLLMSLLAVIGLKCLSSKSGTWRNLIASCQGDHRGLSSKVNQLESAHYTLPSGDKIPAIALGTWKAEKGQVGQAVRTALNNGYHHIDGAWAYRNEAEVGEAWKSSGIAREKLWLTSKLWNNFHAPEDVEAVLDETLTNLQTSYLDLYLIHWPVAFKKDGNNILDQALTENPLPTWKKLEEMVAKGKIRNIGVSNFNIRRLQNLTSSDIKIRPAINQVELNWFNPQLELVKWSKENNILLEAYSPLGSDSQVKQSLALPQVKQIAAQMGITGAQVIISWLHQRGVVVLPKSVTPSRIKENLHVVKLPEALFEKMELSATSHSPSRVVDPSKSWGVDIFDSELQ